MTVLEKICQSRKSTLFLASTKADGQQGVHESHDLHRRDEGTVKAHNPKNKSTAFQENTLDVTPGSSLSSCVTWATY